MFKINLRNSLYTGSSISLEYKTKIGDPMPKTVLIDANVLMKFESDKTRPGFYKLSITEDLKNILPDLDPSQCEFRVLVEEGGVEGGSELFIKRSGKCPFRLNQDLILNGLSKLEFDLFPKANPFVTYKLEAIKKKKKLNINLQELGIVEEDVLVISNQAHLIDAFDNMGCAVEAAYQEGQISADDTQLLEGLEGDSKYKQVLVYIDVDATLSNRALTLIMSRHLGFKQTILNEGVINLLLDIQTKYPHAVFKLLTSRYLSNYEDTEDVLSTKSVQEELFRQTAIKIQERLFTGILNNGKHERLNSKVVSIQEDYIMEKKHKNESPKGNDSLIIFLDDSEGEIKCASRERQTLQTQGVTLLPFQVYADGDLSTEACEALRDLPQRNTLNESEMIQEETEQMQSQSPGGEVSEFEKLQSQLLSLSSNINSFLTTQSPSEEFTSNTTSSFSTINFKK